MYVAMIRGITKDDHRYTLMKLMLLALFRKIVQKLIVEQFKNGPTHAERFAKL